MESLTLAVPAEIHTSYHPERGLRQFRKKLITPLHVTVESEDLLYDVEVVGGRHRCWDVSLLADTPIDDDVDEPEFWIVDLAEHGRNPGPGIILDTTTLAICTYQVALATPNPEEFVHRLETWLFEAVHPIGVVMNWQTAVRRPRSRVLQPVTN